jgi:hypothetical protein
VLDPVIRRAWLAIRSPAGAIGATAVAIAAAMAAFSLVKPIAIQDLDRIVNVSISRSGRATPEVGFTASRFASLRDRAPRSLERLVGATGDEANLSTDDLSQHVFVEEVSGPYFELFEVQPLVGRLLTADESTSKGACCAAVISEQVWRRAFRSDARTIGATVRLMAQSFVVVGVVPTIRGVRLPELSADVWIPSDAVAPPPTVMEVFARLKPGTAFVTARDEVRRLGKDLDPSDPTIGLDLLPAWRGIVPASRVVIGSSVAVAGLVVCGVMLLLAGATARASREATRSDPFVAMRSL